MATQGTSSPSWKLWALIGGLLVLPLCLCGFCLISGLGATALGVIGLGGLVAAEVRPAQEAADGFLSALRDEQWEAAYARCTPSFQRELGGPGELARQYGGERRPATWSFSSWSVKSENGIRRAELGGTLTVASGERMGFSIELRVRSAGSDEVWEVNAFTLHD